MPRAPVPAAKLKKLAKVLEATADEVIGNPAHSLLLLPIEHAA
jgi:hypothetical protein